MENVEGKGGASMSTQNCRRRSVDESRSVPTCRQHGLKIVPQPVLHVVVIPGRVQKNIISSDREHDPQPQPNANFKDAGIKPSHAGARMLMGIADDAGQASDGGVDARLICLGNFF